MVGRPCGTATGAVARRTLPRCSPLCMGVVVDVDLGPGRLAVVLGPVRPDVSWALTASVGSENKRHR
jgi:hypothetical protein